MLNSGGINKSLLLFDEEGRVSGRALPPLPGGLTPSLLDTFTDGTNFTVLVSASAPNTPSSAFMLDLSTDRGNKGSWERVWDASKSLQGSDIEEVLKAVSSLEVRTAVYDAPLEGPLGHIIISPRGAEKVLRFGTGYLCLMPLRHL